LRNDNGFEPEGPKAPSFAPDLEEARVEEKREARRETTRDQLGNWRRSEDMEGIQLAIMPAHISTRLRRGGSAQVTGKDSAPGGTLTIEG